MTAIPRRIASCLSLLAGTLLAFALACPGASAETLQIDETRLVAMLDEVVRYYDEARPSEAQILSLLPIHEKDKESASYKKLRFLLDTHQKVTTSLNNLVDILYIYLKVGNDHDQTLNEYLYNRSKNIVTFLNSMVYFLTVRNQEIELGSATDVQKLYEAYLVRLTTLLYSLNKDMEHFHR